ncbi:MAG: hypothetical protein ISS25_02965 [Nanoarchaeota archaeon]|nr:hypothetical protein [DPANN group archaeon]MBL7116762.1 hypothetical protein [Nanoarchaeota archaeon]
MAKKQVGTKKIKKKKWYPVIAPKFFGGKVLGETLLADSSAMKGRHLTMNLINIIGDPKKQNINIQFLIRDVKDGQGITEIVKYERIPSFTKRVVRRGRNKIDDSFIVRSGDGKRTRVKTLVITNSYIAKSVGTKLRKNIRRLLKEAVEKNTFEKTIDDMLKGDLLKEVRKKISKISPVRIFDIKVFKIEEKREGLEEPKVKKQVEEKKEEVVEEKKEEVKQQKSETQSSKATSAPKDELLSVSESQNTESVLKEEKKEEKVEEKKEKPKEETKKIEKKAPAKKETKKKEVKKKAPAKKVTKKKETKTEKKTTSKKK